MSGKTVLVTGGSGFIGVHAILQLLEKGYTVRTTVRSLRREADVRRMIAAGGAPEDAPVRFFEADLTSDAGWSEAVEGADYVLHIASPFPLGIPRTDDELIVPARDGALRVLRAASAAAVRRVVMTSSFAAIGYGNQEPGRAFTEDDWTDLGSDSIGAYVKSKTIAERAAWDFMAGNEGRLELAVVNPVGVFGPVLGPDYSTSIEIVRRLLDGALPGIPRLSFGVVDVRDVADLHIRAMTHADAAGERFLAVAGDSLSMMEMAALLRERMGDAAGRVPTRKIPDWVIRVGSLFDESLKQVVGDLGRVKHASPAKAKRILGWEPRTAHDAVLATADSLVRHGLLKG